MRGIKLEGGGACLYPDNDEMFDADNDFSHIDKRIQDVLGQYQKDFMCGVSTDNTGATWGDYGSFLPVTRSSPIPTHTRRQTHIIARSPFNPTTEVRPNPTIQANEAAVMPQPGIPPLSGKATPALNNAAGIRSPRKAFLENQPKAFLDNHSDNKLPKVQLKGGTVKGVDNSAIYCGLGLDDSPSSSFEDSPLELDATFTCMRGLPETSPFDVIRVMTLFPVPDGRLLSPLSDNLLALTLKEINSEKSFPLSTLKAEHESISFEGKMNLLKERKVKQINNDKVSEFERKNCEDPTSNIGHCSKRMEESMVLKGKDCNLENTARSVDVPADRKGNQTTIYKDNDSSTPFPFSERSKVGQSIEVGSKLQKQPHVRQGTSIEQVDSLASPHESKEKIQSDKSVIPVMRNNELSHTRYIEQNSKKSTEQPTKKKVKEEFEDSFSSRDAGMRFDMITKGNSDKSTKQERKTKHKVKARPDDASQVEISVENPHDDRKTAIVEKIMEYKKKHRNEDFQGMKDEATVDPLMGSSNEKRVHHFQMEAKLSNRKERPSSEGKKKARKSQDSIQLTSTVPKVSFRVGSSAVHSSQQPDCGRNVLSLGETQKELREKDMGNYVVAGKATLKRKDNGNDYVDGKATLMKRDNSNHDVAGKAVLKEREKVAPSKDLIAGVPRREKCALGGQWKDKSEGKHSQYPSNVGSNPRQDLTSNSHVIEKQPAPGSFPTEIAPLLIQEDWVQCDKCQTWRLLPHNIKPDDLPKRWLCSMLTWLPGMNNCNFTEEETREALLALYQPLPLANGGQIQQPYPSGGPPMVTEDAQFKSIAIPATDLDVVPDSGKRRPKEEVHAIAYSKKDQLCSSESGNKQNLNQFRMGSGKSVVIGKKREGSKVTDIVLKKVKRDLLHFGTDVDHLPSATVVGNDSLNHDLLSSEVSKDILIRNLNISKKLKEKTQKKPAGANEDYGKDNSVKKRKSKNWHIDPVGTETLSSQVPLEESINDITKVKRQKLKESHFPEKEANTTGANDKGKGLSRDNINCGDSSAKVVGRREDRPSDPHHERNMAHKGIDGKQSFGSGPELRLPALVAATSSSSKVSSTFRVKMKSHTKCSPVGSISSSPLKVSRSDHDRSRNQASIPDAEQELSLLKKNLEVRHVAPDFMPHHEGRTEGKSKRELDFEVQFCPAQEEAVNKMSAVKHVDRHPQLEFEPYESKLRGSDFKEHSSHQKLSSADHSVRSLNVACSGKHKSDDIVRQRVKPEQEQFGSSRDNPSSTNQELEFEKADGYNSLHDNKGKLPKLPGFSGLVADDTGASGSGRKESSDLAARTALREATDLKHSADRLKTSGSGFSTQVFFQAALKFLQGASLLESGNAEVYTSTAKLCHYCAHEFEKSNDVASAALAYKCMEVSYMRVVYGRDVTASRDRNVLQLAMTIPEVESPSSSGSDVDNVNNPTPNNAAKSSQSSAGHGNYVISAENRLTFDRVLDFAQDVNLAMDAARKSQAAFAAASVSLGEAGNDAGISSIKRVLDFSFHDVDELLHLVRLAMEAFSVGDE